MAKSCEYVVCIGFEANVAIRAKGEDEALEAARRMMDERAVFRTEDVYNESAEIPDHDGDFVGQKPMIVEVHGDE